MYRFYSIWLAGKLTYEISAIKCKGEKKKNHCVRALTKTLGWTLERDLKPNCLMSLYFAPLSKYLSFFGSSPLYLPPACHPHWTSMLAVKPSREYEISLQSFLLPLHVHLSSSAHFLTLRPFIFHLLFLLNYYSISPPLLFFCNLKGKCARL